ncbi:MAG: non-ribosomal peptide synthetase [Candidatus Binatia bacterium]
MNDVFTSLPREQLAIRAQCFHPTGNFIEFKAEDIEQSIPERFERMVGMHLDQIAVKSANHEFTYAELNRRANQVAHALVARCDKQAERIGLLLESDAPLIAAILGVLKAGKIYVPLNSSLPRARIAYMLEDTQASSLITNTKNLAFARELSRNALHLMNLDELDPTIATENPRIPISPDALTWILYTSGSTGRPKGVVQNHRNVLYFVRQYTNGLHLCADDRLSLLFSFSANGAAHDTFSALLNGASLYPFDVKEKGTAPLADWLGQNRLSIYCSVPTVFRYFLETFGGTESFPHLRLIKLIGEPVARKDVELYRKFFSPDCVFINRLGSTETGTICWYFINKETQIEGNLVPVGHALEDHEILLLDGTGRKVDADDIGEIAVKGRYLTPGYWQKPDLTSAAFLPTAGPERLYRTGDIGRMLSDGRLLCLGRKDSQVKIRGHRVEIAEIEMALLNLGMIKAAVVVAREDPCGDSRLVAYLVPNGDLKPTVTKLRRALAETLPEHMIPSSFLFLDAFPSAPNGKIDRKSLPDPGNLRPELDTPYAAPTTPVEESLARIWAEVLSLDQVGIHDNFFDLGGHSLLATQVASRVREALQVNLPLRLMFDKPTIAELAEVLRDQQPEEQ